MADEGNKDNPAGDASQTPGMVVSPEGSPNSNEAAPAAAPIEAAAPPEVAVDASPQQFETEGEDTFSAQEPEDAGEQFSWNGPEFVSHDKNPGWYLAIMGGSVIVAGIVYLLTRDLLTAIMMVVVAIFLCIYSARKPKSIPYKLDSKGIDIGPRHFVYEEFRYFTAVPEGRYVTLTFIPLKRFSLPAGMCYDGPEAEKIINSISRRLPFEQHKLDIIETIMQSIRF
jgi:hypothetical protein